MIFINRFAEQSRHNYDLLLSTFSYSKHSNCGIDAQLFVSLSHIIKKYLISNKHTLNIIFTEQSKKIKSDDLLGTLYRYDPYLVKIEKDPLLKISLDSDQIKRYKEMRKHLEDVWSEKDYNNLIFLWDIAAKSVKDSKEQGTQYINKLSYDLYSS